MSTSVKQGQGQQQQQQGQQKQQKQQQQQQPKQQDDQPNLSKKQQYQQATKQQKYKQKTKSSPWLITAMMGLIPGFTLLTSFVATIIRLFSGWSVKRSYMGERPAKYLKLYEYEGDPNSRLVREALTMLDLDCIILPCPKGSKRFRAEAVRIGGKEKFPLLVDENNDRRLYGARNIVPYLFRTYGNGNIPLMFRLPFVTLFSFFASLVRGFAGVRRKKGIRDMTNIDPTSIEFYSYEASPHCRLVREVLSEMEIPYLLHNVGKRSPKRRQFVERSGRMMVPFLIDSNTEKGSRGLFESCDIMKYLCKTYGHYY